MFVFKTLIPLFVIFLQNDLAFGRTARIAGGSNASKGDFPFQVSLQKKSRNNRHFCGGTIVHEKFILTAAHCVYDRKNDRDIRIVAGVVDLTQELTDENLRNVVIGFVHSGYHPLKKESDIALVQVDRPYTFNTRFINKANLVSSADDFKEVTVAGWGLEKATNTSPTRKLKKTTLKVYEHAKCVKKYEVLFKLEDTVFCTRAPKVIPKTDFFKRGVCNGDSGGPAVINGNTLVGVIKGSYPGPDDKTPVCGSRNYPDMHTEVSKYRQWIDDTIAASLRQELLSTVKYSKS